MNKNIKRKLASLVVCATVIFGSIHISFADGARVVTLGANLTATQKQQMLDYFGVKENEAVILEVTNAEERKYLEGVASEAELGRVTISCSYVEPTSKGNGINVKTANLTWATSSMIASTLATAGLEDANVIAAAPFPVSGTGALSGVMKAFEDASGETLDETKKEIASEELIITGTLGEEIGAEKAAGIINDIKADIIKNNTNDTIQIANTIVNITNNYNVNLSAENQKQIEDLMTKIAEQDYNYNSIKNTLENVSKDIDDKLDAMGESVQKGIIDTIKGWFTSIGDWFSGLFGGDNKDLGILENTNDSILGDNAQIDATDKDAIQLPSSEEVEGFFAKLWNWFTGLFDSNSSENEGNTPKTDTPAINEGANTTPENSTTDENSDVTNDSVDVNKDTSINPNTDESTDTTVTNPETDYIQDDSQDQETTEESTTEIPPAK